MRFVLHTGCVSPHVLPWAKCVAQAVGAENFRYICEAPVDASRLGMGWREGVASWSLEAWKNRAEADDLLLNAGVLYSGFGEVELFEQRALKGLRTFYGAERWFKPVSVGVGRRCRCSVPGWVRMLVPSYRRRAGRFVKWLTEDPNAYYFAIGPWAKKDMMLLGVPESKIIPWGYFVAPSTHAPKAHAVEPSANEQSNNRTILKVLWVGRMIPWKRVDTIVKAVREVERVEKGVCRLTLVGDGPEKMRLQKLAKGLDVTFLPSQPIGKIREIMREHDVYVLASNAEEGWGAALNEALEEGMKGLGTYEAGASATMLSEADLFHAGDWRALAGKLARCARQKEQGELRGQGVGEWSAQCGARRLAQWMR